MNEKYHRLRAEDRKVIHTLRKSGFTQAAIAVATGSTRGTVSKELSRNRGKSGYRPRDATRMAGDRARGKKHPRGKIITGQVKIEVEARLHLKHSPEQISGKLAKLGIAVSHESIYSCGVR